MPDIPIREAAFAALAAALAGLSIDGQAMTVERNRSADVDDGPRPLLVLIDGDQDAEGGSTLDARYVIRAIAAGYLHGADEMQLAARVNEWHAKVVRAALRPGGAAQVTDLVLGDGLTAVRVEEGAFATEPATVVQSEAPMAACTQDFRLIVHAPWGNPFITVP